MTLLVIYETLGLFDNTMAIDGKYSLCYMKNLAQLIQMELSNKIKIVLKFLLHFWNLRQALNILSKKMILIGHVFPELRTADEVVR